MASMNSTQRAASYLKRIIESSNKDLEFKRILDDINSLVWTESKRPLSKAEKLAIIEEIERLFHEQPILENKRYYTNASDNSGAIDIIGALKRGVKD